MSRHISDQPSVVDTAMGRVQVERSGDGPPVLVIHGSPGGADQGTALGGFLARAGFEVIAPARAGYQGTPLEIADTIEKQAELHVALLDALGIEKAAVFAWSGGGPSAYVLAATHPERVSALVTASAVSQAFDPHIAASEKLIMNTRMGNWVLRALADHAPKSTIQSLLKAEGDLSRKELKELTDAAFADEDQREVALAVMRASADHAHRGAGIDRDYENFAAITSLGLETITAPTLVVWGDADEDVPPAHSEHAAAIIPKVQSIVLARGTHVALWIHPESGKTQNAVAAFIR